MVLLSIRILLKCNAKGEKNFKKSIKIYSVYTLSGPGFSPVFIENTEKVNK